ncbi:uncharacterized protein LY89DRAFT_25322 [Mollisia scopiformis]|uniref:Uncharacterized protein n=1 Tax=Mollisia scopiformis TaxID=149040 RepID=A0A194XXP5_MOLSC|nr:uncharacterized protein LY89DRAFT_25322 [Mollisia scopiformis]KUJ24602.1 hypothetical protein LY89DRAFT_25322 [Mollisia scopiformis]
MTSGAKHCIRSGNATPDNMPTISYNDLFSSDNSGAPTPSSGSSAVANNIELGSSGYCVGAHGTVIDTFIAQAKKCKRTNKGDSEVGEMETRAASSSKKAPKKEGVGKAVRRLRQIAGKEGLGPRDYKELAKRLTCEMNLLDLMQISPDARTALRELGMPVKVAKTKSSEKAEKTSPPAEATQSQTQKSSSSTVDVRLAKVDSVEKEVPILTVGTPIVLSIHPDDKAFKVPVTFKVRY